MNIGQDINKAATLLEGGGLVAIPTETVYGLAANALNEDAVSEIFRVKNRPQFDPLIVHIPHFSALERYAALPPENDLRLLTHFWPGPLTYLSPKKSIIPDLVTSGSPLVAIRVPKQPLTLALLQQLDFPLAAPSANPFGYVSPTTAQHVANQLGDQIPYILDGGAAEVGIESTILGRVNNRLVVYRLGGVSLEEIEDISQEKIAEVRRSSSKPDAPGMLSLHYSPHCKLALLDANQSIADLTIVPDVWLGFGEVPQELPSTTRIFWLSQSGDVMEAARNVFRVLRQLDEHNIKRAAVRLLPEIGLGRAVNDRLLRAAAR